MALDVEQIFGAVDVIVKQRLQEVSFDKTIICTVVDDSDKKNGHYIVTDGNIKFDAYTTNVNYRADDQVRVSILNGDFSEKKFIVGKYVADDTTTPIAYTSPLTGIVPISDNLVTNLGESGTGVFSIRANDTKKYIPIQSWDLESDSSFRDLQSNGIYSTISLSADFKTLLSNYSLSKGRYGLFVLLGIRPAADSQLIYRYELLDSSEMFGNPYAFAIYSHQEKKINIASSGTIAAMALYLYQTEPPADQENPQPFEDSRGNLIPVNKYTDDIFVRNISIGFGSDISSIPDNTVEIYTKDSLSYVCENATEETNEKSIELLWYNKDDNNNYIGFKDGLYAPAYDEIEYLEKSHQDSRLVAQVGREGVPTDKMGLKLAADIQEAKPILIATRELLTTDLKSVLQGLLRQVTNAPTFTTGLNTLINVTDGTLLTKYNESQKAVDNLCSNYQAILRFGYNTQNKIENQDGWNNDWDVDYYTSHVTAITDAIEAVEKFFESMESETQSSKNLSGYRGIYDTYYIRTDRILKLIKTKLNQTDALLLNNHSDLISYKNKTEFVEYTRKDFTDFHNKYCIYWYRYEKNYILTPDNGNEYNYGRFMPDGWRRLAEYDNLGLPTTSGQTIKQKVYYPAKALDQTLIQYMDNNTEEQKYIAILFHNHEMYKSNILTFTNSEPEKIPNEYLIDKNDALKIEHDAQSFDHYQSYDIDNTLVNIADSGKIRQLLCSYEGLVSGNEALENASIYWYVPNTSTMLTFDKEDLKARGFATDADLSETEKNEFSRSGYTYFYKKIEADDEGNFDSERYFFYKIKPYYEQSATQNTIEVYAYLPDRNEPVTGSISFTFSTFGTNGTKYTLAIVPSGTQIAVLGDSTENNPLELDISLRDASNQEIPIIQDSVSADASVAYNFKLEWFGPEPDDYVKEIVLDAENYVSGAKINRNNLEENKNSVSAFYYGILKATTSFKYDDEVAAEEAESNNIANVDNYQKYRVLELNTLYPVPYSSSGLYYISGPTSIIYNNQGTVSHMSEDPYCLYRANTAPGDTTNQIVENQKWTLEYYDSEGNWITSDSDPEQWSVLINYMPVLNSTNGLTAAPLYMDGLNYYPVAICSDEVGNILWVQPIVITQNRYASSTLNDWNGSLTIDEKNGTILSTMVGAGKKNVDNSFSGVLMGDIGAGANFDADNYSGLGLYGFNEGAQSFAMTVDGKAFFGKAGRGRIHIDGDNGSISSASYEQAQRGTFTAGMNIDLDDGFIDMYGTSPVVELSEEEFNTAQANGEYVDCATYRDYQQKYSNGEYVADQTQSHVRIDTTSPYFKIHSASQEDDNKYIVYIGDDKYYLESDDYVKNQGNFLTGTQADFTGRGTHFDLKEGWLDAYNLKITSKNILIDSTDEAETFFAIKDNAGKILFEASAFKDGTNNYYLQTSNFSNEDQLGTQINLGAGTITSYDFSLKSKNIIMNSGDGSGTTANPYFQIVDSENKELFYFDQKRQEIRSASYNDNGTQGMLISLSEGLIDAYNFTLSASSDDGVITIDSDPVDGYPFKVEGYEKDSVDDKGNPIKTQNNFKVDWSGTVNATGGVFNNITANGGKFSGNISATGTISGGTITGASITAKILKAGGSNFDQLIADSSGVKIKNATIENCTITNSSIANGDGSGTTSFDVNAAGYLEGIGALMENAEFENCTVKTLLTCEGDITLTGSNSLIFGSSGDNKLFFSDSMITCSGSFFVQGNTLGCTQLNTSSITTSYYDGSVGSRTITIDAYINNSNQSIVTGTLKCSGNLWVGESVLQSTDVDKILDLVKNAPYATENWVTSSFAAINHNHDGTYASASHTHNYAPKGISDTITYVHGTSGNTVVARFTSGVLTGFG